MLRQVLQEVESTAGPVDLRSLSRKLGVEQSALAGMVAFWVRKGRLQILDPSQPIVQVCSGCGPGCSGCGASCSGATTCPLAGRAPLK